MFRDGGAYYFVSLIDKYYVKHKKEVFTISEQWKGHVKNHTTRKMKVF